ncbi:MAG TPA: hypothetical protein VIP05_09660 [Burkholderiaceae bacterium]
MAAAVQPRDFDCPSAQPDMAGARPFGVVSGTVTEARVAFFKKDALENFDWRERFEASEATQLFRFAARCEKSACGHYDGGEHRCSLGRRVATALPEVVDALPPCLVRGTCRWHAEQGPAVCLRCPQVVTMIPAGDGPLQAIARPAGAPASPAT